MKEEEYLQLIEGKLEAAIENIKDEMKLNDKDIAQLQELYWENNSDFDEYGYEEYENRQQMFQKQKYEDSSHVQENAGFAVFCEGGFPF